jgi:two-component system NtrC family sensor kinase
MAGETILIIEDRRENIVHLANNVLKPQGYRVLTAMDGQRGLKRIVTDKPDLVILDLNMPKMDGLEVLSALQERDIDVPVILTTFYGSEQVAEQAMRLGAVDYIVKPYDVRDMLKAVEKALADRPPAAARAEPDEVMPLTRQVERWMRDMNILTRVGKALVAQVDMERVLSRTVEAAIYVTRADYAFLFLARTGDEGQLRLRAARGPLDRQVRILDEPVEEGLVVQAFKSGQTMLSRNENDLTLTQLADAPLNPPIATPMRWQRETVGVLVAARESDGPAFTEADVEWLAGLADYAAIAVHNARSVRTRIQQAPPPSLDEERLTALKKELAELAARLRAAGETVERLTRLLDEEEGV